MSCLLVPLTVSPDNDVTTSFSIALLHGPMYIRQSAASGTRKWGEPGGYPHTLNKQVQT